MIVVTGLCALQLYQFVTGNYDQIFMGLASVRMDQVVTGAASTPRLGGPINAPNLWGQVLVAVIPFAIYRLIDEKNRLLKLVSLLSIGLMLFVIFNTYSRGAYLALAVVLFFLILELRVSPVLAASGAVVILLGLLVLPSSYTERFLTLTDLTPGTQNGIYQDTSFRGRSSEMLTGLAMFERHPLLGVGAGNYPILYQEYAQLIGIETRAEQRDAHSLYVQIIAETGIIGIVIFIALMVSLLSALGQASKTVKMDPALSSWQSWLSASRLSIIAYLTTSLFLHGAYLRFFWILVALAITAVQLVQQQQLANVLPRRSKPESSTS